MIILAIHTMRKRGLTLREAVTHGKNRVTRRGGPPTPPKSKMWEKQESTFTTDYGSMRNDTVTPPQRAMSIERSGSTSSQRPLMALQRSERYVQFSTSFIREVTCHLASLPMWLQCFVSVSIACMRQLPRLLNYHDTASCRNINLHLNATNIMQLQHSAIGSECVARHCAAKLPARLAAVQEQLTPTR
jgi:hypothetical protein